MAGDMREAMNGLKEVGLKLYMWFIGFVILLFTVILVWEPPAVNQEWFSVYLLWIGTFLGALLMYLLRTDGGMRRLAQIRFTRPTR